MGSAHARRREIHRLAHRGRGQSHPGAGLLLLDWPPHPLDPVATQRGYLLNVYVEPPFRRRKLASHLIEMALAEARRRRIRVVSLHSTAEARPLYVANGFRTTNEMFYVEPVEGRAFPLWGECEGAIATQPFRQEKLHL